MFWLANVQYVVRCVLLTSFARIVDAVRLSHRKVRRHENQNSCMSDIEIRILRMA